MISRNIRREDGSTVYAFTIKHTCCLILNYNKNVNNIFSRNTLYEKGNLLIFFIYLLTEPHLVHLSLNYLVLMGLMHENNWCCTPLCCLDSRIMLISQLWQNDQFNLWMSTHTLVFISSYLHHFFSQSHLTQSQSSPNTGKDRRHICQRPFAYTPASSQLCCNIAISSIKWINLLVEKNKPYLSLVH